jgi:hypothetical protein
MLDAQESHLADLLHITCFVQEMLTTSI